MLQAGGSTRGQWTRGNVRRDAVCHCCRDEVVVDLVFDLAEQVLDDLKHWEQAAMVL